MGVKKTLVSAQVLACSGSNHTPLLLDSPWEYISFEFWWLCQDGFVEMLAQEWGSILAGPGHNSMEV